MSQTTIEIEKKAINASAEAVFNCLADFLNYEALMPDAVSSWEASTDHCRFKISPLPTPIGLRIEQRHPHQHILIRSEGEVPFSFTLKIEIIATSENTCEAGMVFEAKLNMFMKMMVEKPMEHFFGYLTKQVQKKFE